MNDLSFIKTRTRKTHGLLRGHLICVITPHASQKFVIMVVKKEKEVSLGPVRVGPS